MILIKDIKSIILKYLFQCSTCKFIFEIVFYEFTESGSGFYEEKYFLKFIYQKITFPL